MEVSDIRRIEISTTRQGAYIEFYISCKKYEDEQGIYKAYLGDPVKFLPLCILEPYGQNFIGKVKISVTNLENSGFYPDYPNIGFILGVNDNSIHEKAENMPIENIVYDENALHQIKKQSKLILICDFNKNIPCPLIFIACKCRLLTDKGQIIYETPYKF